MPESKDLQQTLNCPWTVVEIEIAKGGFIKRDAQGNTRFWSPLPCPFNYGSVPNTHSEDGDPIDAIVFGAARPIGSHVITRIVGLAHCVDKGLADPKLICSTTPLRERDWASLLAFLQIYFRGKSIVHRLRGETGETRFERLARWT